MTPKGFLLVLMNPPPAFEEEFNAWYDLEHVPERLAVPGFESARRYISTGASPRYLAMYDLETEAVLESEAYRRVGGDNSSPWTKRVTARARVYRAIGTQIYPAQALTPVSARVELLRFRDVPNAQVAAVTAGLREAYEGQPQTLSVRVLAHPGDGAVDVLGFVAGAAPAYPVDMRLFGEARAHIDLINSYGPF